MYNTNAFAFISSDDHKSDYKDNLDVAKFAFNAENSHKCMLSHILNMNRSNA